MRRSALLDDIDLTRAMVGDDLVLQRGDDLTLYHRTPEGVHRIGSFTSCADAWAALDAIDS